MIGVSGNSLQVYFARSGNAVCAGREQEYLALMPPAIRASIMRYKRWQDRQATLFGKLLLLKALRIKFRDAGDGKISITGTNPRMASLSSGE